MKFQLRQFILTFPKALVSAIPKALAAAPKVLSTACLHAWLMVLCVALTLSLIRVLQIGWHWPDGYSASVADLWAVLYQGARFDLKVSAAAAVLAFPLLLILSDRAIAWIAGMVATVYVIASLINLHYFGFYKTPIDPVIFGLFEDDTGAILQTIWTDFPVLLTLALLIGASWATIAVRDRLYRVLSARLHANRFPGWFILFGVVVALFTLALTTKGTLRAMALGRQNVSVTTSQFLNDMVPNGVIAFKFAADSRRESQNLSDALVGLKRLGYDTPLAAAHALDIDVDNEDALHQFLLTPSKLKEVRAELAGPSMTRGRIIKPAASVAASSLEKKNLLFFLMESWSAEPFLYQAPNFDVLGRLAPTLSQACHFNNFDSAQPGTHPSLEAILFSSPITPLTLGPQGRKPIPWAIPLVLQRAGYHTLFVTSARSGWRDLDRVLKTQGFDEVVDANDLRTAYPEATLGIWGVWDSYVFRYLSERLKKPGDKPLFVFVLTSTNHPPYDLPPDYQRVTRERSQWGGERNSEDLWPNLDSWHYATDLLGGLVQEVRSGPLRSHTLIAATGDHNVRSFGLYALPERRPLARQVPFVIWDEGLDCGSQLSLPASHRDMFPTLLPLLGVSGTVRTGRNLMFNPAKVANLKLNQALSLSYYGPVRSEQGSWTLGDAASFMCTSKTDPECEFDAKTDALARAQLGLLDWNVRSSLK